jgi:uncharacterized membrane protein
MGYVASFAAGATLGVVSELLISKFVTKKTHHCVENFTPKCALSVTVLNLYGWAAVLLTYLLNKYKMAILPFTIIAVILITILECIGGKLSSIINNGKKTWDYSGYMGCACDGYVSLPSSAFFAILVVVYAYFIYPYVN